MIIADNLVKIYKSTEIEVVALQGLDLTVEDGEFMAIIGNSGSGKSTLLNMIGGLDRPSAGTLEVAGRDLLKFTDQDYTKYKREIVGFVWQNNARNLIHYMTAQENVEMPMQFSGQRNRARAQELLEIVGLSARRKNKLHQLSGGEQQRVAIALALSNNPKLLLADEPTGAVDSRTAAMILDIFREINQRLGVTIVIVTHDPALARKVDRVVAIRDGRTSSEMIRRVSYAQEMKEIALGLREETHQEEAQEEYVVVDNAGRMQVPREYLEKLHIHGKSHVSVDFEEDKIVLRAARRESVE